MIGASALNAAGFGPWVVVLVALVATIGALAIHWLGRSRASARAGRSGPTPQWLGAHADLPQIREAMLETAGRMGIAERVLPRIALPNGADGEFVFRDDRSLVYCGFERGSQFFEHRTDEVDELLYRVFCDRAWTHAYLGLIGQELSPEDHEVKLAAEQETLLARADPRWAERLVCERARLSET